MKNFFSIVSPPTFHLAPRPLSCGCSFWALCGELPVNKNLLVHLSQWKGPNTLDVLTPNHLLAMKSSVILYLPSKFERADVYSRKGWHWGQRLTDEFWQCWKKGYLKSPQVRQKWTTPQRNIQGGEIVIKKDESIPRSTWKLDTRSCRPSRWRRLSGSCWSSLNLVLVSIVHWSRNSCRFFDRVFNVLGFLTLLSLGAIPSVEGELRGPFVLVFQANLFRFMVIGRLAPTKFILSFPRMLSCASRGVWLVLSGDE